MPANEVWGKVMFLHLSVSHSVHRGGCASQHAMGQTPPGQTPPGRHPHPGQTPPGRHPLDTTVYGQQVGGTHPTGMHTCFEMH